MSSKVGDIFSGAYNSLQGSVSDIVSTGAPAVLASIEQYGAQQLAGMAQGNITQAQNAANAIAASPSSSAFGATLSNITGSIAQNTFFKTYGTQCLIGLAVVLVIGYSLK